MAKVKIKNEESLEKAKERLRGATDYRRTKCGVIATKVKWPKEKRKRLRN